MLIMASCMTFPASNVKKEDRPVLHPEIDNIGILQTMWIAQRRNDLRDIMRSVKNPTSDNLRRAGLIDVCLASEPELSGEPEGQVLIRRTHIEQGSEDGSLYSKV